MYNLFLGMSLMSVSMNTRSRMSSSEMLVIIASHQRQEDVLLDRADRVGGVELVSFSECFIPGYPAWIWDRPLDPELTVKYIENSLKIDSQEMETIRAAAATHNINVVLGFSENDHNSLYMAQATISGATGEILMKRRKFKPTHAERTVFGDASGSSLMNVVDLPIGKVGALNCWEHIQPLLKYHTFLQREEIHVSSWPALDPFVEGEPGHWGMILKRLHRD
ncbi:carbon-nitrogen hydrolase [Phytophthora cinnamomi]|uniref:carbon-nitrogen hydrolase n=1 Tax=Phytophthora cinnamomi TaxID=4785 RepID=UPI003559A1BE|nr:carbon-nitrogen hydrolase [Phytophthora cinnamomi]